MHDLIFIGFYFLLTKIQVFFIGGTITFDEDAFKVLGILVGLIVFLMFFELAIAIVKRLLMIFRWQIF